MKSATFLLTLVVFGQPNPLTAQSSTPQANQSPRTSKQEVPTTRTEEVTHNQAVESVTTVTWGIDGPYEWRGGWINGSFVQELAYKQLDIMASVFPETIQGKTAIFFLFRNFSVSPVILLPDTFTLAVFKPRPKPLAYVSPDKLLKSAGRWNRFRARLDLFAAATAMKESQSTASANLTIYDNNGNVAHGTITENRTTTGPHDAEADAMYQAKAANEMSSAAFKEDTLNALSIRATTLQPQMKLSGLVYFERDKGATSVSLRVPINGVVFEFMLPTARR